MTMNEHRDTPGRCRQRGQRGQGRTARTLVAGALLLTLSAGRAVAGNAEQARAYREQATAAFALGHHAEAAEAFEKAFQLSAEPALLYNAAQAHRLAGNKERALLLYQSYARIYGAQERRAEVQARIDELTRAIARDKAAAPPPASAPVPPPAATDVSPTGATRAAQGASPPLPPPLPPAPNPSASETPRADQNGQAIRTAPAARDQSIVTRPWFWVAGGGVAAVVIVVLVLTLGGTSDPSPSIGRIAGN